MTSLSCIVDLGATRRAIARLSPQDRVRLRVQYARIAATSPAPRRREHAERMLVLLTEALE